MKGSAVSHFFFFTDRASLCASGCLELSLREGLSLPPECWIEGVHHHTQLSRALLFCFCFKVPFGSQGWKA